MRISKVTVAISCASCAGMPADTSAQATNALEIVIGNGPHAGTYRLAPEATICLYVKDRKHFSAAYKDTKARDPKVISGAGINVFDAGAAGSARGEINIRFGDPKEERPAAYEGHIPQDNQGSLALSRRGKLADIALASAGAYAPSHRFAI